VCACACVCACVLTRNHSWLGEREAAKHQATSNDHPTNAINPTECNVGFIKEEGQAKFLECVRSAALCAVLFCSVDARHDALWAVSCLSCHQPPPQHHSDC